MKACDYCGRKCAEEDRWCSGCGTEFLAAAPEDRPEKPVETDPFTAPPGLDGLVLGFQVSEGFSRPDWEAVRRRIEECVPREDWPGAWRYIAGQWLEQLRRDWGGACRLQRSENFLCLADIEAESVSTLLTYAESALRVLRDGLKHAAREGCGGPHILLLFSDRDDYFAYVSYYYPEGIHPQSSGMCLIDDYAHIAIPFADLPITEQVVVHELVHILLRHWAPPRWLNEGIALVLERRVAGCPFSIDRELTGRHAGFWDPEKIQTFWSGYSFDEPGDGNELSYSLAEILVHLLEEKGESFLDFLTMADRSDAGQGAAETVMEVDLGHLVGGFLGPGDWRPQRKAITQMLEARAK